MEALRVLHLINGLGTGGAERSLAEMLPTFIRAGVSSTIACSYRRAEGVHDQVSALGVPIHVLPGSSFVARTLHLRRLLRQVEPHLVHTSVFESDVMGRLATAGTRTPLLTSVVNTSYDRARVEADPNVKPAKLRVVQEVDRLTARLSGTWFHAVGDAVRQATIDALGADPERIVTIHRGRDPARLGEPGPERRRRVRQALGLAPDAQVILNVGRQEYQKGQQLLLEIADELFEQCPRAVLLIAGRTGNATPQLERLHAGLRHGDRVRFLGHRSDVPDLLAAADLFAFPSLFEGFSGALVEALALGVPVLGWKLPAIEDVVDDGANAVLAPVGQTDILLQEMVGLLQDPRRLETLSAHGRNAFVDRYTVEAVALRMVQLFRRVAGHQPDLIANDAAWPLGTRAT